MNGKWRKYNIWNWKIEKFSIGMLLISDHNLDTRLTNLPICTMYNKWLWKVGIVYASDEDKKFQGFTFDNCTCFRKVLLFCSATLEATLAVAWWQLTISIQIRNWLDLNCLSELKQHRKSLLLCRLAKHMRSSRSSQF